MKKILIFLLSVLLLGVGIVACSDENGEDISSETQEQPSETVSETTDREISWPEVSEGDDSMYQFRQSDFIRDPKVWKTPYVRPDKGFEFEVEISSLGTSYNPRLVRLSIEHHELGTYEPLRSPGSVYEWGYSFTHLDGHVDGAGREIKAGYPSPPRTRADALNVIEQFLLRQYLEDGETPRPWISKNGHYMWHHYAGEFGYDILASEVGENINSYQMHIAFNRGAAKQYRTPWAIDFSAWHGPSITDYSRGRIWGDYSGPDHGHSMSLLKRTYFASYMGGAPYIIAEAGGAISFYDEIDEDGFYKLSPYGEVGKELYDFSQEYPDIGIAYIPFGIVLDYYHGVYPGFGNRLAFHHFPYNEGDDMTWNVMDLFFPGGWEVMGRQEKGTLVNGPYGDTCDVILQNAHQRVLDSYPVLILSGDIDFSQEEVERYKSYVRQGGTLIMNSAYLGYFPEYEKDFSNEKRYDIEDGNGKVIVYGPDYSTELLDSIIREQLEIHMPLSFSENIQHVVSIKNGSMFVALINSEGVTKDYREPPVIDETKEKTITVTYTGDLEIKSVKDIYNNYELNLGEGKSITVTIGPGELTVVEFSFD